MKKHTSKQSMDTKEREGELEYSSTQRTLKLMQNLWGKANAFIRKEFTDLKVYMRKRDKV